MNKLSFAFLVAAALLVSGCTAPTRTTDIPEPSNDAATTDAPGAVLPEGKLHLRGHVFTPSLQTIAGANVSVAGIDGQASTGSDGAFDFGLLERRIYTILAAAPGFLEGSLTVTPEQEGAVRVVLEPGDPVVPFNTTVQFTGILQCAFEALIISPSCDSAITAIPGAPAVFDTDQSFLFSAERGWKTLVVDVVFNGEDHPGLDGLRIAVRGTLDADGGGEYVQYGRWHGSTSFVARLEPGGAYTDGTEPVPANATGFQVDVYPHSHAYHTGDAGFLGIGFGQNVRFDVFATLFYVEPAPEGYSFRQAGP